MSSLARGVESITISEDQFAYGFNCGVLGYFRDLEDDLLEIGHLNPDEIQISDRIGLRKEYINRKFAPNDYIFDTFENEEINEYLTLNLPIFLKQSLNLEHVEDAYKKEEWEVLQALPSKEFNIKVVSGRVCEVSTCLPIVVG